MWHNWQRAGWLALSELPEPQRTQVLGGLLADRRPRVVQTACEILGRFGEPRCESALAAVVVGHPDARTRLCALHALAQFRGPQVRRALALALARDSHREVRAAAARALPVNPDPRYLEVYTEVLQQASAREQLAAIRVLAQLPDDRSARALLELLTRSRRPRLRRAAFRALQRLGAAARPALQEALGETHRRRRRAAQRALRDLRERHPAPPELPPAERLSRAAGVGRVAAWALARPRRQLRLRRELRGLLGGRGAEAALQLLRDATV